MGKRFSKFKEKLKAGVAKTLARGADIYEMKGLPLIVGGLTSVLTGSLMGSLYMGGALYTGRKAARIKRTSNKKIDRKLDYIPMEEIKNDFESALNKYSDLKNEYGENENRIETQEQLDGLVHDLKIKGYDIDGKCRLFRFASGIDGIRVMGHNFVKRGSKYAIMDCLLHEANHSGDSIINSAENEKNTHIKTTETLYDVVKDTPEHLNFMEERLNRIASTLIRKAGKDGGSSEIRNYLEECKKRINYELPKTVRKQLSSSRLVRCIYRMKNRKYRSYDSNVYIKRKSGEKSKEACEKLVENLRYQSAEYEKGNKTSEGLIQKVPYQTSLTVTKS